MSVSKKITQRVVDSAKPDTKVYWVRDREIPGFCLKVTPTGTRTFNLDFQHRPTGRNRRWKLGDARWMKAEEARRLAHELKSKVMADIYPTTTRQLEIVGYLAFSPSIC